MAQNDTSLDAFISTPEVKTQQETKETIDLEDEFAKLLNDFIKQDAELSAKQDTTASPTVSSGLDSFITPSADVAVNKVAPEVSTVNEGLDSFISPTPISSDLQNTSEHLDNLMTPEQTSETETTSVLPSGLKTEEAELARAISNFQDGIYLLADNKNLKVPQTEYTEKMLFPNYKPSIGKKIAQYLLDCWDLLNKADPENMKRLPKDANDEEYLSFAETLDNTMQLIIISYVEILINLEICEVKYEQKKEIMQKNKIKKELYEEYMELQERKMLFIQKLKEKNFPIDVERLINNYFRVAQKDPDGSFEALVKNPATFSPIEVDKIRPKFFGLIKVTPEDGIKANQKIGKFIKNLKV